MALVKLPINKNMDRSVDESGLSTNNARMYDCYVDNLGNINRRPGLTEFVDLGTDASVDGLFYNSVENIVVAVSGGDAFYISYAGSVTQYANDSGTSHFETDGTPVSFALIGGTGSKVYASNGGTINLIDNTVPRTVTPIADVDAPTLSTYVAFLDNYLISNRGSTNQIYYSNVGDFETWSGDYVSAESSGDRIWAIDAQNQELYIFGQKTTEVWYNDGVSPFARLQQGVIAAGCVARYSVAWCKGPQTYCWLDESNRVVRLKGRTAEPISLSINSYIQAMTRSDLATGHYVEVLGRPTYVLRFPKFPEDNKTIAYDFLTDMWYEWSTWDPNTLDRDYFKGVSYATADWWGKTLIGDYDNGKVYYFSDTNYLDDDDTMRTTVRTGNYDHGTITKRKFCNGIYVRLKKTNVVALDGDNDLLIKYRDNGSSTWSNEKNISVQKVGDTEFRAKLTRLGSYYTRQWEFSLADEYPLCIVSIEEDVDIEN